MTRARVVSRFLVGVGCLATVMSVLWLALWAIAVPVVRGWTPVAVLSGSMGPNIDTGDVVIAQPSPDETLGPGTVIVFDNPAAAGSVTHRVVAVDPAGDYVTKGDANARVDSTLVPPDTVRGVGRILVPIVGTPFVWAERGQWVELVGAAVAAAAMLWASRWAVLARFNPWSQRQRLDIHAAIAQIGGAVGVWPSASTPATSTSTSAAADTAELRALLPPRDRAAVRRQRRHRASVPTVATVVVAVAASLAIAGGALARADAAFTATTTNPTNSLSLDTLAAPTSLSATGTGPVTVDWTATTDTYATGHRIYRATSPGGPYTQIAQITPRTTVTYNDSPADGTYYYVVRAYYLGWESINSNEVTATVQAGLVYSATGPSATATNSTTLTVNYPAGTQQNDLLLLVEVNAANQNITTPTGWTLLADTATQNPSQYRFTIWWKLAAPAETSVDLPVNTNGSGATAWVIRYRRPSGYPPNPITATAAVAVGNSGPSASLTPSPDITTNQANATVVSIVAIRDANALSLTTPNSFTLRATATQSGTGQARAIGIADRTSLPLPSTPASPTWAQSGTTAQWAWATIAFS